MSYVPRPRKLEGDFQKTLILVNGEPLDGKTTICQKILNESLGYISFDQMIWEFGTDTNPDWVHVSYESTGKQRKQILKAVRSAKGTAYLPYK